MQRMIYQCDHCKEEIGKVAHFTIQFAGMGNTSGVAIPPKAPSTRWTVKGFPSHWVHIHFGCVAAFFKALKADVK